MKVYPRSKSAKGRSTQFFIASAWFLDFKLLKIALSIAVLKYIRNKAISIGMIFKLNIASI